MKIRLTGLLATSIVTLLALAAIPEVVAQTWTSAPAEPMPVTGPGYAVFDGKLYIIGGVYQLYSSLTPNVQVYDAATATWSNASALPYIVNHPGAAAAAGRLFVFGGDSPDHTMQSRASKYDPSTDTWTAAASLLLPKYISVTATVDGLIYSVGGATSATANSPTADAEVYNPTTDTWSNLPPVPSPRYGAAGTALNGKIYVFGGADAAGNLT